jgi:hypothetical protein
MVLDAGGGTVDITMHRCLSTSPFRLQEIACPEGGDWGSTYVDAELDAFVRELLGPNLFSDLQKTQSYLDLMVRAQWPMPCAAARLTRIYVHVNRRNRGRR